jgi:hypothetical protein
MSPPAPAKQSKYANAMALVLSANDLAGVSLKPVAAGFNDGQAGRANVEIPGKNDTRYSEHETATKLGIRWTKRRGAWWCRFGRKGGPVTGGGDGNRVFYAARSVTPYAVTKGDSIHDPD